MRATRLSIIASLLAMTVTAAAQHGPVGPAALDLDQLAVQRQGIRAYQASSYQRDGGNYDRGQYLGLDGSEHVLLDVKGPGCIYRIWMTGMDLGAPLRMYFDGESTPTVDLPLGTFFSGTVDPFLAPLVGDDNVSSGGFICYVPLPFREGCRITCESANDYYNITYHRYASSTGVTTFDPTTDLSTVADAWNHPGVDYSTIQGTVVASGTTTVEPGATLPLADLDGPGSIQQIEITLPGMGVELPISVFDDGRAFGSGGYSEFTVDLDPANTGVTLTRRLDPGIGFQTVEVFVDGTSAGTATSPGAAGGVWLDSAFDIPAGLTAGKSSATIRVSYVDSALDINEFRYWIDCTVGGAPMRTDEVDVGNDTDEADHAYTIANPTWQGSRMFTYAEPADPTYIELLTTARFVATWDHAAEPQIDIPLGSLFASQLGPRRINGWPAGIDGDRMFCWFPMPFAEHAELKLVNAAGSPLTDLSYRIAAAPLTTDALPSRAWFRASHNTATPATLGEDYLLLDVTGSGHFVGVVEARESPSLYYLEGDERIYIDGSLSPQLYGTGTEDFYNGGWYFNRGRFSLPTHGNPSMESRDGGATTFTDMYRFFVGDLIPFTTALRVGIEHGGDNDTTDTDFQSVAFYYHRPEPTAVLTDTLALDDADDRAAHGYAHTGETWQGLLRSFFEGDTDDMSVREYGYAFDGEATFTVAIRPGNAGVLLRRTFDYGRPDQDAAVYVDGTYVGQWHDAGENPFTRYRQSEFMLPASLTQHAAELAIRLVDASVTSDFCAFDYAVYSLKAPRHTQCGDANCDGVVDTFDIDSFILAISDANTWIASSSCDFLDAADTNRDGVVDTFDVDAFIEAISTGTCPE